MKINLKIFFLVFSLILSFLFRNNYGELFINTLYSVLGIMFSIGLGLIITFNISGVKNKNFVNKIRINLKNLRTKYISYFTFSTIIYVLESYLNKNNLEIIHFGNYRNINFNFNISTFTVIILLFSIAYCIVNFINLQKLNEDIFDEINKL